MLDENKYKTNLVKTIKARFPGCIVSHLDAKETQGIPDILVLYEDQWATLEGKKSKNASVRPNQPYYVERMNEMSFSRFIYPENEEEVLDDLEKTFRSRRSSRVPRSK